MSVISRFLFGACVMRVPESTLEKVMGTLIFEGIPFARAKEENGV